MGTLGDPALHLVQKFMGQIIIVAILFGIAAVSIIDVGARRKR